MKKSRNHYRVLDRGWVIARHIKEFKDAISVVEFLLNQHGFSKQDINASEIDFLSMWFKPNKYAIQVIASPSTEYVEIDHPSDELVNRVLSRIKAFNGKALHKNVIAPQDIKYKPGVMQSKEVRFAESANWAKGGSVIYSQTKTKHKELIIDTSTSMKVAKLQPQGYFDTSISIEDIVRKSLSQSSPIDVYKRFKGNTPLSNNQLNKLIYKCTHC